MTAEEVFCSCNALPKRITFDLLDGDFTLRHVVCGNVMCVDWTSLRAYSVPMSLILATDGEDEDWYELRAADAVYHAYREDDDGFWDGNEIYADEATARTESERHYADEEYGHPEGAQAGTFSWRVVAGVRWELYDGDRNTGITVSRRQVVRGDADAASAALEAS